MKTILQIVPKLPGGIDGVGDYALNLAAKLCQDHATQTIFGVPDLAQRTNISTFDAFPLEDLIRAKSSDFSDSVLHYVNYGYQRRGIPFALLSLLNELRRQNRGRFVTIFHELYASGPIWSSAFWLQPLQKRIARSIARLSDACIVSSESMGLQLREFAGQVHTLVHPVVSNFGEPNLKPDEISNRDPQSWVICGGSALIERSLRSFYSILNRIPAAYAPRELFVLGGKTSSAIRELIAGLADIKTDYRPEIDAADASQVLCRARFGWLDYFRDRGVPSDVILKSSAFAAFCAHGVIPIVPERGSAIAIEEDRLPGPFFIDATTTEFPPAGERAATATKFYDWYWAHTARKHLASGIAAALGLNPDS